MTAGMFGTYRLDGELGRGGMGIVYRAFDTELERHVALKVLPAVLSVDPDFRERFRREARAAAQLTAPQVVQIHRFGEVDGQLFLDMRLIDGRDLAQLLREEGPLAPERAVAIVASVAAALDAAKAQGLLHRDVKPANILVAAATADAPETAYLGDFGIARSVDPSDRSMLTATGSTVGTLDYMAPERFTTGQVDHGVDVYALACVLYECLTGAKPFQGEGALAMMHAHCYVDPPVLAGPLGQVIAKGMAKNPADRHTSAGEFAAEARRALTAPTVDVPVERPPGTQVLTRPKGRSPLVWVVPAAVFVAVAVIAAVMFIPSGKGGTAGPTSTTSTTTSKSEAGVPAACSQDKGTLTVGVVAPLTGDLSHWGLGIKNSAQLAVDQANRKCAVPGYKLAIDARDDQAKPEVGKQAATALASDATVIGVVGTLNSAVAQEVIPVLAEREIAQISPANTNPRLTRGADTARPVRDHANYFRMCATDDLQGPFAAEYLVRTGKTRIAVVSDGKSYGAGLAADFSARARAKGATIVAESTVGDTDFRSAVAKIKPTAPDAIFYGGEYLAAGPLSKQAAEAGITAPLIGGDGIYTPEHIKLGGREGDLAVYVGAPADDSSSDFRSEYTKAGFSDPYAGYGPMAYDAANVIISSAARAIGGNGTWSAGLRPAVLTAISRYSATGATGAIGFDQFGDTTNHALTLYEVRSGEWKAALIGTVER